MMRKTLPYMILIPGAMIMAFPFLWMITTAFKTLQEATAVPLSLLPTQWQWQNVRTVLEEAPFQTYFTNTFVVAGAVTAAAVLTAVMAGYALARLEFPGRTVLFWLILATMMIPFEIALIPNYVLITSKLGWYDTYAALIVPFAANAFSIFLARQAFMALPKEYFDAATMDGCGHFRFIAFVAGPLIAPTIVTIGLFAFLASYNSLLWPIVATSSESMRLIQPGLLYFESDEGVRVHLLMCASAIVIFPTVALYFLTQRFFLAGLREAGIKG